MQSSGETFLISKWKSWKENTKRSSEDRDTQQLKKMAFLAAVPVQSCQMCKKGPGEIDMDKS